MRRATSSAAVLLCLVALAACGSPAHPKKAASAHISSAKSAATERPSRSRPQGQRHVRRPTASCATGVRTLQVHAAARTGGMSNGVIVFAVTNISRSRCSIFGYPQVGFRGGTFTKRPSGLLSVHRVHNISIKVRDGDVWDCPDTQHRRVLLDPGSSAYFALGTATAYGGPEIDVTAIRLTVPGAARASNLAVSMFANAPAGHPVPVSVTALRAVPWPWMP